MLSEAGEVAELTAPLRGQAFAVFREQDQADRALALFSGALLFGKQMVNTNS
jgi:hypothetical protein